MKKDGYEIKWSEVKPDIHDFVIDTENGFKIDISTHHFSDEEVDAYQKEWIEKQKQKTPDANKVIGELMKDSNRTINKLMSQDSKQSSEKSLRDEIVMIALKEIIRLNHPVSGPFTDSQKAYKYADAMLEARKK